MTILPAVIFGATLLLSVAFELVFAVLGRRRVAGFEKQEWAVMYWIAIIVILCCCGIIRASQLPLWFPGLLVMFVHVFTDMDLSFIIQRWRNRHGGSSSGGHNSSISKNSASCVRGTGHSIPRETFRDDKEGEDVL